MAYYTTIINHILDTLNQNEIQIDLMINEFNLMVHKFGFQLLRNNIKHPYKKAHNQLLKILQMKIDKTKNKINIYDYIPECKSIYVLQLI